MRSGCGEPGEGALATNSSPITKANPWPGATSSKSGVRSLAGRASLRGVLLFLLIFLIPAMTASGENTSVAEIDSLREAVQRLEARVEQLEAVAT